ncbi:MAG: hypothetical protein DCC60_09425 [Ignavibacteriae bacterium]|nr:MAG: hypothetical protein DCC60_09425 [Ignavibacteriota bacterium]
MNINADGDPHEFKILKSKGSYQWWYFDGIDFSSTYSFVIIFSTSFPFSPAYLKNLINDAQNINPLDFARVSFKLFKHGKLMHQLFEKIIARIRTFLTKNPFTPPYVVTLSFAIISMIGEFPFSLTTTEQINLQLFFKSADSITSLH